MGNKGSFLLLNGLYDCLFANYFLSAMQSFRYDIVTNGKVLYTDATIKILQYMNKLVKMTLKGRLENLDSEFFADGFLFGKILLMGRARTQA